MLGHTKGQMKSMGLNQQSLVDYANEYSRAIGCAEPPGLEPKTIGLLGLKGVPGLRIEKRVDSGQSSDSRRAPSPRSSTRLPIGGVY